MKADECSMKFCFGDSIDAVLRKFIALFGDTFCEAGTSIFWFILETKKVFHDYLKLVRPLKRCKLMKERMPFKKSVRMSMCERVLMIFLSDFHQILNNFFF